MDALQLDRATCRRARLARDARFDGRFFVGVTTTGIFCRPVCPAVAPAERNVCYFPSAAAAAEAGFRACLRCRPECAPGTPAWAGASTTVARALRLMGEGAHDEESLEALAARLGVGTRHLRRLFLEHLGASPIAVLQTRRLLSAKRLIDETDMPLTSVAMAAGFGSIRRFNAAFLSSFGRSPRALRDGSRARRAGQRSSAAPPAPAGGAPGSSLPAYTFQLRYRPPFDWDALLGFLAPRAIPGVEVVEPGAYRRSIEIAGRVGWFEVTDGEGDALRLEIVFPDPAHLLRIASRVRRVFDLDADPMTIESHLAADALLAPLVERRPGVRVPGAWDGFELGVRAILGQQVSVRAATTLAGRLVQAFGRARGAAAGHDGSESDDGGAGLTYTFPAPPVLAAADLTPIGLPGARARAVSAFAGAVASGALAFDGGMDPAAFRQAVRALPGIGDWTAEYIALRALGDPDAFPSSDLGLLRATGFTSPHRLAERAEGWQPWRGYAAMHLWLGARG